MADYHSPTVIQPYLPIDAISPLEHLLLTNIFDEEIEGDTVYFFAELGYDLFPEIEVSALRQALAKSETFSSQTADLVRALLVRHEGADDDDLVPFNIAQDLENQLHLVILQDIIRRAPRIDWITVSTAYTCTRMQPDGFGGRAALISADLIRTRSTDELLEEFMAEARSART